MKKFRTYHDIVEDRNDLLAKRLNPKKKKVGNVNNQQRANSEKWSNNDNFRNTVTINNKILKNN